MGNGLAVSKIIWVQLPL